MSEQPPVKSLYERLGGVYAIASVVDDFIDRIMIDPRLNSNPLVDEAHHRVSPAGFKYSHLAPSTKLLVLSGEWVKVKGQRLTLAILYPFPLPLDPTH